MKIVCCLAEVPAHETRYEINSECTWIEEADLTYQINECDEYALEEALRLQEKHGGEVIILTLGREQAEKSMRKALAMGANRGILVKDEDRKLSSPHALAATMAEVLKQEEYDLVLAGTQSDHYSYAQTAVILAELLDLPHVTIVMEIEVRPEGKKVKALREMESGWFQWVEIPFPALLTIQAGISHVRYASLKGIMQARNKEIRKIDLNRLSVNLESIPRLDVLRLYFPRVVKKAEILQGDTESAVATLVERLKKEAKVL